MNTHGWADRCRVAGECESEYRNKLREIRLEIHPNTQMCEGSRVMFFNFFLVYATKSSYFNKGHSYKSKKLKLGQNLKQGLHLAYLSTAYSRV